MVCRPAGRICEWNRSLRNLKALSERKDIENVLAIDEKRDAILEYIVACDHPEVWEGEEEGMTYEQ